MSGNEIKTIQQERAKKAFEIVKELVDRRKLNDEYISFAKSFPALLHSSGLVQSLAFAKNKNKEYLGHLEEIMGIPGEKKEKGEELCQKSRNADIMEYIDLSRDVLECAVWLKRYVEAFQKNPEQ